MTEKMVAGVPQADGHAPRAAHGHGGGDRGTFMAMARLPLTANVLFVTVMATRCRSSAAAEHSSSSPSEATRDHQFIGASVMGHGMAKNLLARPRSR